MKVSEWFKSWVGLFYPRLCAACGRPLFDQEQVICYGCIYALPYTNYHLDEENNVTLMFRGRVILEAGAAMLHFRKGGRVQQLMHQLKYKGMREVGVVLGKRYGYHLKDVYPYGEAVAIIPVPLHPKKLRKRGFNQSEQFAMGLASALGVKVDVDTLIRRKYTDTQTRKTRYKRFENMQAVFEVTDRNSLAGKHVMLVDDVITTGSTLEACIEALQVIQGIKISVITMAMADK